MNTGQNPTRNQGNLSKGCSLVQSEDVPPNQNHPKGVYNKWKFGSSHLGWLTRKVFLDKGCPVPCFPQSQPQTPEVLDTGLQSTPQPRLWRSGVRTSALCPRSAATKPQAEVSVGTKPVVVSKCVTKPEFIHSLCCLPVKTDQELPPWRKMDYLLVWHHPGKWVNAQCPKLPNGLQAFFFSF